MKSYPLNQVKYYSLFKDMIDDMAKERGNLPAVSWFTRKGEEKGVSWGKLRDDVLNLQAFFVSKGLAGKHIAILGENSYEWLLVYFAATYCGAVAVCVDVEQSDETICQMLDMADASAMFYIPSLEDLCLSYKGTDEKYVLSLDAKSTPNVTTLIEEGKRQI